MIQRAPLPPAFLRRPRLTDLLDDSGSRLIVVRGPGGSGKTLAVADWLRERRLDERTVWVIADERAEEGSGFWLQALMALQREGFGSERLDDLLRGFVSVDHAPDVVLAALNADSGPERIVIDDAHLIDDGAAREVVWLLRRLTRTQLVVTTRRRGLLESGSSIARFEPLIVTGHDLAFDRHETAALVEIVVQAGRPRPRFSADSLFETTHGHPLSTRVALATLHAEAAVDAGAVAQLTADDLLPARGPERDIALRVALAPAVSDELSVAMTGRPDAPDVVAVFAHEGLGEHDEDGLFRFHDLIREAFSAIAGAEFTVEERRALLRLAAEDLGTRSGWGTIAVHLAAQAHASDLIWRLYLENFSEVMNLFREPTMAYLNAVPTDVLVREGGGACALAAMRGEDERRPSIDTLNLSEGALASLQRQPEPADPAEAYLRHLAIYGAYRTGRRYAEATRAGEELVERVIRMAPGDRERVSAPIAVGLLQTAISNILAARFERAQEVLSLSQEQHPVRMLHQVVLQAYVHAARGRIRDCRAVIAELPQSRIGQWHASVLSNGWYIARAIDAAESGDGVEALRILADVRSRSHTIEHWPFLIWAEGLAWLAADDLVAGREHMRQLLAENRDRISTPEARSLMIAVAADLELATGNREGARKLLDLEPNDQPSLLLARARVALDDGDTGAAKALSQQALALPRLTPRHRTEAYLTAAVALHRHGSPEVARRLLHRALVLARENELMLPLLLASRAELEQIAGEPIAPLAGIQANPFATVEDLRLTGREREVLTGLLDGLTLAELATRMYVSSHTIKSQTRSLYRKLGVGSRKDAVRKALRLSLHPTTAATKRGTSPDA